jgi:uncharacterized protein
MISREAAMRSIPVFGVVSALSLAIAAVTAQAQSVQAPPSIVSAVKARDVAGVTSLLKKGADVNAADLDGTTPLMLAVQDRDTDMIQALLKAGASVDATNRYGATALQTAARNGDASAATLLLNAGANPGTASPEGETALMAAARTGNVELIKALLAGGTTAAGQAANKADPDFKEGWKGQTALMWAAADGHADAVQALIAGGANVNDFSALITVPEPAERRTNGFVYPKIPKGRMTALHFAARNGHMDAVQALMKGGADLNSTDADGTNALVLATLNGHPDIAVALLEAGADPKIADKYGRTVLFEATDMNTLDANARPAPHVTGEKTYIDVIKLAIAKGADVNATLKGKLPVWVAQGGEHNPMLRDGATVFLRAAMSADLPVMNILLAAGADPLKATDKDERPAKQLIGGNFGNSTPLMAAAGVGWRDQISRGRVPDAIEAIKLLLAKGADINQANNGGETALTGAAMRGEPALVEFLLENGANANHKNARELTAMDIATGPVDYHMQPNPAVAEVLRKFAPTAKLSAR